MNKAVISWSGGKDSCAAYHRARRDFEIVAAVTMFNEDGSRSRSHGLRPEIVAAQVARMGLQHVTERCAWSNYDAAFSRALATAATLDVTHVIFGDILFEEHRAWATRLANSQQLTAVEPLWGLSTTDLYRDFLSLGGRARIVTIRSSELDESFLGRELSPDMLDEFVALGVDPCGERGEYHTVVTDSPLFSSPIQLTANGCVQQSDCWALDVVVRNAQSA